MKLKKQMFLPVLLSLSVFFASTVTMSASAYAAAIPRTAAVWELAEAAPNNTEIPEVKKDKGNTPGRSGNAKSRDDSSFFDNLLEKIALMFLVYMFLEAINALLNDFFHDGDTKIKIRTSLTAKERIRIKTSNGFPPRKCEEADKKRGCNKMKFFTAFCSALFHCATRKHRHMTVFFYCRFLNSANRSTGFSEHKL